MKRTPRENEGFRFAQWIFWHGTAVIAELPFKDNRRCLVCKGFDNQNLKMEHLPSCIVLDAEKYIREFDK